MSQIQSGTVSVTNGSSVVDGIGVDWSEVTTDCVFSIADPAAPIYFISQVHAGDSPPTILLAAPYVGTSELSVSYGITKDYTPNKQLPLIYGGDVNTRALMRLLAIRADVDSGGGWYCWWRCS